MKKNTKSLLIIVAVIVVLFLGYFIIKWNGCIGCGQNNDFYEEQKAKQIQEQIKLQLLEDLDNGAGRLAFHATTLKLKQSEKEYFFFGINNVLPLPLNFKVKIEKKECKNNDKEVEIKTTYDEDPQFLNSTDRLMVSFNMETESHNFGDCLYQLLIINLETEEIYAEKAFFVQIT